MIVLQSLARIIHQPQHVRPRRLSERYVDYTPSCLRLAQRTITFFKERGPVMHCPAISIPVMNSFIDMFPLGASLRHAVSNDKNEQHASAALPALKIPKNRSTGDLLSSLGKIPENEQTRIFFDAGARSPVIQEHEHGVGISGLRRIRQNPPSRAPTQPSSPTTPYALPPRSSSMTLGLPPSRGFGATGPSSPNLSFSEDLSRFPSESLHSFSFAHQSEDALHNRQSTLKRALEFMQDRLGIASNQLGVMTAQAKISGDADVQNMMDLLVRAKLIEGDSPNNTRSKILNGPLTGPAQVDGNVFEKAFIPRVKSPEWSRESSQSNAAVVQGATPASQTSLHNARPSVDELNDDESQAQNSSLDETRVLEEQKDSPPRGLKRTYTDLSLLTLQTKLMEALAKPYKATDGAQDNSVIPSTLIPSFGSTVSATGINIPSSHVHGRNSRWAAAAQAIFTTEASSPWTILAANDLACLIFGVTKAEVKSLSMLEVVRADRRKWLEEKLRAPGTESTAKMRHPASNSARTSPTSSSTSLASTGGITAKLLSKPSWRLQRAQTSGASKKETTKGSPNHASNKSRGVLLCGDIMPIQKRNGATGAASLWVKEKKRGLIWVLEEVAEDVAALVLDEDAIVVRISGASAIIWGQSEIFAKRPVQELIPGLPLIDGFAVDKTALEKNEDAKFYAARTSDGVNVPISVSMNPASRSLRVSSFPHIAGIIVVSASTNEIISSNSVFSAVLFGQSNPSGRKISQLIPQFDDILEFLTEEDKVKLVDGMVVPEHSFRRARTLLAVREGGADAATVFLQPQGLVARHRDGSEINIDLQMRVVRSEPKPNDSHIEEKSEDGEDSSQDSDLEDAGEYVYALWITYSRHFHSALRVGTLGTPILSRPGTPHHQPSPGQAEGFLSPAQVEQDHMLGNESPQTLSQKIEEAASEPISASPPQATISKFHPINTDNAAKDAKRRKKNISDFVILEDMGQGAYGQVKLARYSKTSGTKVVLKYVTKRRILVDTWTRDRRLGTVPLEIHVLDYLRRDDLRHPNIVEMIDFFEDDVNYYIEMVPHGLPGMDLFDYIEMRTNMDETECRTIFLQVVAALHHFAHQSSGRASGHQRREHHPGWGVKRQTH